jgi:hypothetical protein
MIEGQYDRPVRVIALAHHSLTLAGPRSRAMGRRRNAMAVGMDTELLKILRSGGFSGSDEPIEKGRSELRQR